MDTNKQIYSDFKFERLYNSFYSAIDPLKTNRIKIDDRNIIENMNAIYDGFKFMILLHALEFEKEHPNTEITKKDALEMCFKTDAFLTELMIQILPSELLEKLKNLSDNQEIEL